MINAISMIIIESIIILAISFALILFLLKDKRLRDFKIKIKEIKRPFLLIVSEWLFSLCLIVSLIISIDSISYYKEINITASALTIVSGCLTICIIFIICKFYNKVENIFLAIMIPIGLGYMFCIFPDFVPDEQAHFMKAFLTSTFDFSGTYEGYMYGDYAVKKITDFHTLLSEFYVGENTQLTVYFDQACSYNFLVYIIPAMGLLIGRLLHLSIYFCYYIGRMLNFFVFLYFGYKSIQITPKCKWLFFTFYFNPMMIQQGMSFSSDVIVNSLCVMAVAYFLYLYYKPAVEEIDVVIVLSLLAGILVAKYAFLPVFCVYFIIFPKLFRMSKRCWIIFAVGIVVAFGLFGGSLLINSGIDPVPAQKVYFEQAGVNSSEQLKFILNNPLHLCRVYYKTLITYLPAYLQSFVSYLGWLDIVINPFSFFGWYILILFVSSTESSGLSGISRMWSIIAGFLVCMFIVLGLYLTWTGVGGEVALGVQGRYFVPAALLFLLAFSNDILKSLNRIKPALIIASVVVLNIPVLFDLMSYFSII